MPTAEQVMNTLSGTNNDMGTPKAPVSTPTPAPEQQSQPTNQTDQPNTPPPVSEPKKDASTGDTKQPSSDKQAQPQFNLDEELVKITGGTVKSKEDLAGILEKVKSIPEFETRVKTYEQEMAQLKTKAEADPFANDLTRKLNELYKANASQEQISSFMRLQSVQVDKLTPMEASSLALQIEHGLTPDEAKQYLEDKYHADPENPDAPLSPADAVSLKVDSTQARTFLNTQKAEVSQVPEDKAAKEQALYEQQNQQRIAQVEPIALRTVDEVIATAFKEFNINGKEGDDAVKIDLPISPDSVTAIKDATKNYIANYDIQGNDAGIKKIQDFVRNSAMIANGAKWIVEAANQREKQVRAEYNNPSSGNIKRGDDNPNKGLTSKEQRTANVMSALGLNN